MVEMIDKETVIINLKKGNNITEYSWAARSAFVLFLMSITYKAYRYFFNALYDGGQCHFDPVCYIAPYLSDYIMKVDILKKYMLEKNKIEYIGFVVNAITFDVILFFSIFVILFLLYKFNLCYTRKQFEAHCKKIRSTNGDKFIENVRSESWVPVWGIIFLIFFILFMYQSAPDKEPMRFRSPISNIHENPLATLWDSFVIMITLIILNFFNVMLVLYDACFEGSEEE